MLNKTLAGWLVLVAATIDEPADDPEPRPLLVLVDRDANEISNRSRQLLPDDALGTNKAEALAMLFRGNGIAVQAITEYVGPNNAGLIIPEGDACLLAVDNHPTRALADRHIAGPSDGVERDGDAHMGRQAMVVGMRHFSRSAGCRLVAEGIETEAEARTLDELPRRESAANNPGSVSMRWAGRDRSSTAGRPPSHRRHRVSAPAGVHDGSVVWSSATETLAE